MRYLILSDIHGNWEALTAVLAHVRRKPFDSVVFLGDAVGYGASPNQVVGWLRGLGRHTAAVRGNHDRVCSGLDSPEYFNRYAREAAEWTLENLDPQNLDYLRKAAVGPMAVTSDLAICHGSAIDEDAYIFSAYDANLAFGALEHSVILFGHTHVPSLFTLSHDGDAPSVDVKLMAGRRVTIDLDKDKRYLINPGSVGQPRDRDPRAAYAIYDEGAARFHLYRVSYRVAMARRRIMQSGLPPVLGDRLLYGA